METTHDNRILLQNISLDQIMTKKSVAGRSPLSRGPKTKMAAIEAENYNYNEEIWISFEKIDLEK